jgi:hypothetical protein
MRSSSLLLPIDHPAHAFLTSVSFENLVPIREEEEGVVLLSHPQMEGYCVKSSPCCLERVRLAAKIRSFLARAGIHSILVQDEWLYEIEHGVYLIVCQQVERSYVGYSHCTPGLISDLVRLARYLDGLAVGPQRLPLTAEGKFLILNPLLRSGGFRASMIQLVSHLPPELRGIAEIRIAEASRPTLIESKRAALAAHRLSLASEFTLPEDDPLNRRGLSLLQRATDFESIESPPMGEERLRHPELEGYDLLTLRSEEDEVVHFLPLLIAYQELREFCKSHSVDLVATPRVWMVLWQDKRQRAAVLVESIESLTEKESAERYKLLSRHELGQLLLLWSEFRTLLLSPKDAPVLRDGRILVSVEQMRRRRIGELSLSLLPYLRSEDQEGLLREWGELLQRREPQPPGSPPKPLVEGYLLPADHPMQGRLEELFSSPSDFIDRGTMIRAGFEFERWPAEDYIDRVFVVRHPLIEGYLIKTFPLIGDLVDHYRYRLRNYIRRIEGARAIQAHLDRSGSRYLTVPRKWLYRLPAHFSTPSAPHGKFVLLVERLDLLSDRESAESFWSVSTEKVEELFRMLIATRLGDLALHNLPWTRDGRIALIDTESVGSKATRLIRDIVRLLRPDLRPHAEELWASLIGDI